MFGRMSVPSLGPRGEAWVLIQAVLLVGAIVAGLVGAPWPEELQAPALVMWNPRSAPATQIGRAAGSSRTAATCARAQAMALPSSLIRE
jgi:hypothetical protein